MLRSAIALFLLLPVGCARPRERAAVGPVASVPVEDVIDLLPYLHSAVYDARPGQVRVGLATSRDDMRETIVVRTPSVIRFPVVPLHAGASLTAGFGAARPAGGSAPDVTFVVRVEIGDQSQEVLREVVPIGESQDPGWRDVEVPLPRGQGPGDSAALVLEVSGGDPAVLAGWSRLTLFSDGVPGTDQRLVTLREDDVADLLASFPDAEPGNGPLGFPRLLTAPPPATGSPGAPPALVVPPGSTLRWTLGLTTDDALRFRYHVVRESDAATAAGEEGFSVRLRRKEPGAPAGPWLAAVRRTVPLSAVQSGLLRAEPLRGTLWMEVPEAGTWELELRGEGPTERVGVWSAFAELYQIRRREFPRKHAADGGRNIVLVLVDTLRADHLSLYGYERATSPRLDAAAAGGVIFDDCMAAAPSTLPSTAATLTGLVASRHGVFAEGKRRIEPALTTLAEATLAGGYATAAFIGNGILPAGSGFDQGFEQYKVEFSMPAERLTRFAVGWMKAHRDERFFLYLHYMDPHSPYAAPEPFYGMFDPGYVGGIEHNTWDGRVWWSHVLVAAMEQGFPVRILPELGEDARFEAGPRAGIGSALRTRLADLYDGEIRYWDEEFAPVLQALQELHLSGETVVAVVADHGEEFGEEGQLGHGHDLADAVMHVPFVLLGPGLGEPRRVPGTVSLIDVAPTLLNLAGLPPLPGIEGRDLLAAGPEAPRPAFACTRAYWIGGRARGSRFQSAIVGRTPSLDVVHLLLEDRWLTRTREPGGALAPVTAESVPEELRGLLVEQGASLPPRGATPAERAAPLTDREREVLRALGYLR